MKKEKHEVPALLSFFVPTLGQFVKGDVKRGLKLLLILILGEVLFITLIFFNPLPGIILTILFSLIMWIYQIYDAYNN